MKRILAAVLALVMVLGLAACGGSSTTTTAPAPAKDTFRIALDSDIVKLDPAYAYDFTTNPVVDQITQGLLVFDEDNNLQPLLASSWEAKDATTYVYQIRSDVKFSDGTPMTMEDVIWSLERYRDPDVASYLDWMYGNVDEIKQTGDWELTVTLLQPDATWKYVFGTTAGHVVCKAAAEAAGDKFGTAEGGLIGTGPYKFVSWQNGSSIELTRNENYWGEDAGYYDNLYFKIITEDASRVTALQTGDVDCTVAAPDNMLEVIAKDASLTLTDSAGFGLTFLAFNCQRAPFDNADVRNAIYMAMDLESYQENLVKDAGTGSTPLPSSDALFTLETSRWNDYVASLPAHQYDVEGAKALLAKAGYADGFECTLIVNDNSLRNSIALAMQEDLAKVGIKMTIEKVSTDEHTAYQFGDILDANGLRDYDMIMAGWEADYADPSANLEALYSDTSSNTAAYNNQEVFDLISQQKSSLDTTERNTLMFKAFDIITKDTPYVFMYYPTKHLVMNSAYTGVVMNASWAWNLHLQDAQPK
ncbi:MAG: ABC transporter substrate-binding protein [Firmicutes bacterium]|nr:ABC transporter substrate-binding protein [Bacillota bacterium]